MSTFTLVSETIVDNPSWMLTPEDMAQVDASITSALASCSSLLLNRIVVAEGISARSDEYKALDLLIRKHVALYVKSPQSIVAADELVDAIKTGKARSSDDFDKAHALPRFRPASRMSDKG